MRTHEKSLPQQLLADAFELARVGPHDTTVRNETQVPDRAFGSASVAVDEQRVVEARRVREAAKVEKWKSSHVFHAGQVALVRE